MFNPLGNDDDLFLRLLEAEGALADAENQFQRLADALPYGIWTCGPDGELTHISQSFLDLIGMTFEECQRFGWWGKLPPEETEATRAYWLHCLLNATPYNREHTFLGPDTARHAVLVRGMPIKDDQGRVTCWVGINLDIDDRKRSEAALRESERRFRTLADDAPVLIWMTGPDGKGTYYNRRWLELTGRTLNEQLLEGWASCLHPDDRQRAAETFERSFRRKQAFEMSYRMVAKDGTNRLLLDRGVPRFLEDGAFAGYVGCCTDITELREAEAQMEHVSEQFRGIAEALGAMVYDSEWQTGKTEWYGQVSHVFGAEPDDSEDPLLWWQTRVHPEDLERLYKVVYSSALSGTGYETEYRFRHPDGSYIPLLDRGICALDESKNIRRAIGLISRISRSRSVIPDDGELEKLRHIIDSLDSAAFLLDTAHNPVHANSSALEMLRCDQALFKAGWFKSVHKNDRRRVMDRWAEAFKAQRKLTIEFAVSAEFSTLAVELTLSPVRDSKGVTTAFIGILTDITERREHEKQLEQRLELYQALVDTARVERL